MISALLRAQNKKGVKGPPGVPLSLFKCIDFPPIRFKKDNKREACASLPVLNRSYCILVV